MGSVYVLENDSMPGIVKIGMTSKVAEIRAKSLFTTGVPVPFRVAFELPLDDPFPVECMVHKFLDRFRVNPSREFFEVSVEYAIEVIKEAACNYHSIENPHPYQNYDLYVNLEHDCGMEPW